jgi:hypothetical protein
MKAVSRRRLIKGGAAEMTSRDLRFRLLGSWVLGLGAWGLGLEGLRACTKGLHDLQIPRISPQPPSFVSGGHLRLYISKYLLIIFTQIP